MYYIILHILKFIILLFHGQPGVIGRKNISDRPVIYAATHRSWIDPIYLILVLLPQKTAMMGKESLFKIPIIGWIIKQIHVFPVNREKPTTRTIRQATKILTEDQMNLGIFPTGSRYSTQIKSGTAFIQKLSKADIVPVAIQPPKNLWQVLTHQTGWIAFGDPIPYNSNLAYNKEDFANIDQQIQAEFDRLDALINPNYQYHIPEDKRRD